MGIEFKEILWLWLMIPLGFVLFLFAKQGLKRKEDKIVFLLRGFGMSLLIIALANPYILLPDKGRSVLILADRSASMAEQENHILNLINQASRTTEEHDGYGIVAFGENAEIERTISQERNEIDQFAGEIKEGETNLEEGLEYASNLLTRGGRIVAITDGKETTGSGGNAIPLLRGKGIEVDWIPLSPDTKEDVAVTKVTSPSIQYEGEETIITVNAYSTTKKEIEMRISLNDQSIIKEIVQVQEGDNEFQFKHVVGESGLLVYKAEAFTEGDESKENNTLYNLARSEGPAKVLLVESPSGESPLTPLLKSAGFSVDSYKPEQLPEMLTSYLEYQTILFDNVSATSIPENKMLLIEKSVKEFGRGFIMFGGSESFALGGYFRTPIEKLLPVDMDVKGKKELPSLGLVIVLDRSGSMNGQKIALAKEAAARTVSLLRDKDTLGVIAFDDRPWEIVETKPLSDRKKVEKQIRSISPGGGTEIFSSLQQAYESLEDLPLKRKHIILLTDGQSATTGSYQSLVEDGHDKQITLSTVSIGEGADRGLLNDLSQWGKGRFYDVVDASVIPSILTRETVITTRTYIEDNPFYPAIFSSKWEPLFTEGIPKMNAYIATSPKGTSQVEMKSEKNDPILATWRYGLGRTFAFTSDTTGKWTGDFVRWKGWLTFINQLVTRSFPDIQSNPYTIDVEDDRGHTQLKLSASAGDVSQLDVTALDESGKEVPATTRIKAPGDYEVEFESRLSPGLYHMNISKAGEESGVSYQTGFAVPYSKEYSYKGGTRTLEEIVEATGGKRYSSPKEVFRDFKYKSSREQSIRTLLMIISFLLFFNEIAIRRFGLGPILEIINKLKRKIPVSAPKEQSTLEQLGSKVKQKRGGNEQEKPISSKQTMPEVSEKKGQMNKSKVKQDPQETKDDDRLQRLLNAKRGRGK